MSGLDYVVVVVYMLCVVLVGIAASRGQRDTEQYLMGGRSTGWPVPPL